MRKILILFLCSLLLLFGCSQVEKNDNEYEGEYGTYEIIDTSFIENSMMLQEKYGQLRWKIKYTNTTNEPRKPNESIKLDMIVENETDLELNEISFSDRIYPEGESQLTDEEKELAQNGWLNIKPGATVEILVGNNLEEEKIGSISLRNRNEQGQNGEQFEKKVKIEDVDIAEEKVDTNTSNESLTVTVLANQDSWEFTYSNTEIVTSNELFVPLNEKVNFNLMPSDSGHSFWIPAVGGKMDTSTDKTNDFWLEFDMEKANEPDGTFYGKSAEHGSDMDFKVKAIPRDEFNQWVEESNN